MKYLFLIILIFPIVSIYAQLPTSENGEVVFTEVVEVEGLSKEEIYKKAKFWIVSTLKSGDNMVELSGSSSDQIVGTGNLSMKNIDTRGGHDMVNGTLNFKFIVFCKEGRFKYEISNFLYSYTYYFAGVPKEKANTSLEEITVPELMNKEKHINEFKDNLHLQITTNVQALIEDFLS